MSTEKDNEIRASGLKLVNLQSDESISNYFRESLLLRKRGDKDKSLWKWFLASANNAVGKTVIYDLRRSEYMIFFDSGSFMRYLDTD